VHRRAAVAQAADFTRAKKYATEATWPALGYERGFMRQTLMILAATLSLGKVAVAGEQLNGPELNGQTLNGQTLNGQTLNGQTLNGQTLNGQTLNGAYLDGTMLTGTLIDSPSTCAHSEVETGVALASTCNSCAAMVCSSAPQCCTGQWDGSCVNYALNVCKVTAQSLVNNGTFTANMISADGSTQQTTLQITDMHLPPYYEWVCTNGVGWPFFSCQYENVPKDGPNADVWLYKIEYFVPAGCTTVCLPGQKCHSTCWSDSWQPLCPYTDRDGEYNNAIPVRGAWQSQAKDPQSGAKVPYAGGKIPGTDGTAVTFACRDVGAIAKCVERVGYKPWKTATAYDINNNPITISLDESHQACVRMLRADYCGDGVPHTYANTTINVADGDGLQSFAPGNLAWNFEAEWAPYGAYCISTGRYMANDPAGGTTGQYTDANCKQVWKSGTTGNITGDCNGVSSDYLYTATSNGFAPNAYTMDWAQAPPPPVVK
jgi:hypothetical protein